MLEYILLILFFQYDLESYKVFGNYYFTNNLHKLFDYKNICPDTNSKVLIIYKQNSDFIFSELKKNLHEWIIIAAENDLDFSLLRKEIKNFGQECFFDDQNLIIILKKRQESNGLPQETIFNNLDSFLKFNILETVIACDEFYDSAKFVANTLTSNKQYIYFGEKIPTEQLLKCQMFAKMRIDLIECYKDQQIVGYFINKKIVKDFWIAKLSKDPIVENILKLNISKLQIPIFV